MLTHAHEDHVGALPYLLREVRVSEIWATRLTLGLVKSKLDEHGLCAPRSCARSTRKARRSSSARSGSSSCAWRTRSRTRSAICIETAAGRVFHTGDWKLDHTPVDGLRTDVGKLAELGNRGVDLLLGDSTNAERPGFTESERIVGEAFRQIIPRAHGRDPRLVVRLEHPPHAAGDRRRRRDVNRKVAVVGRSMRKNLNIARSLGYIEATDSMFVRPADLESYRPRSS